MAKTSKPKKSLKNRFSGLSKTRKFFVIVLVAVIGVASVRGILAQTNKEDYSLDLPTEQVAVSITNEKPTVIRKENNGKIVTESRGKSINVTASGTVYCTPENDGPVRVVEITQQQVQSIINQVKEANPASGAESTKNNQVSIGGDKQLQLVDGQQTQSLKTDLSQTGEGIKNAELILDTVCGQAQKTVPAASVPAFTTPEEVKPRSQGSSLFGLIPRAEAAQQPMSAQSEPVLEEWTERHHVARINNDRAVVGSPGLGRSNCLTIAARKWSQNMALVNNLYHSPLQATVESECGSGWWRKIGENVGKGGTADSQYDAYMASPGHRRNILDPAFQRVGVGAFSYKHPNNPWVLLWTTQLFAQCSGACAEK